MLAIAAPLPQFFDLNGLPLDQGFVYVGKQSQNPQTSPIPIYWDEAGTIPAAQPLRTLNGYIARNGTPANVYTRGLFSLQVTTKNNVQILYSASSAVGAAQEVITYKRDAEGAVAQTLKDALGQMVSVWEFGAVGDANSLGEGTDNFQAFQAAIDFAASKGFGVYVPDGRYVLKAQLTSAGAVSIRGGSRGTVQLIWPDDATSEGIKINIGGAVGISGMAEVSNIQLLSGNPDATGTALHIIGSNTFSGDRFTSRVIVRDIVCRGLTHPFTDGWKVGVDLNNCSNSLVDCVTFWGRIASTGEPDYVSENAIAFNGAGTPHACAITITNCFLIYAKTAIRLFDFEGALIRGNQALGINTGLVVDNPDIGGYNYPHCSALDNHFNASTACIIVNRTAQFIATSNLLYLQLGAFTGSGIDILGTSNHFLIQGNIFECLKTNHGMNSVVVSSGTSGVITSNVIRRADGVTSGTGAGVWLTAGASYVKAGDNLIEGTSTPYLDQGSNNKVAHSGIVGPRFWESSLEGVINQWGTEVVTLDASGDGVITLPTPFKVAHQTSIAANGDPGTLPTSYFMANQPACTLTTLAFSVRPNPGAVVCRVNWMSKGR